MFFIFFYPKSRTRFFIVERGEESERKRKTTIYGREKHRPVASNTHTPQVGTEPTAKVCVMCPDWELDLRVYTK